MKTNIDDFSIIAKVGDEIAQGTARATYHPRKKADIYRGKMEFDGKTYRVFCNWPDGVTVSEIVYCAKGSYSIKEVKND